MTNFAKIGTVVALSAGLFFGLTTLTAGSVSRLLGSDSNVGSCSSVGGQSGIGGQSTVGGQSNVCKTPTRPFVRNLPTGAMYHGGFVAVVHTDGDGTKYVTSGTPKVCAAGSNHLTVGFVGVGTCYLTAHVTAGQTYGAADGKPQVFPVGKATPNAPMIGNLPKTPKVGGSFTPRVVTSSTGTKSVTTDTPRVCTVGTNRPTVKFVATGKCTLVPHVDGNRDYVAANGAPQSVTVS